MVKSRESTGRRIRQSDFDTWGEYYAHYQRELALRFLIPYLSKNGVELGGAAVLDIGCGDGGATAAFAERADRCVGIDVGDFEWPSAPNLEFRQADILDYAAASSLGGNFDLVLLRDVIEHIENKVRLMEHVLASMRVGAHLLVTFPPYFSAFGGHQQAELKGSRLRFAPYVHWHPGLRHVARARMTIGGFERLAARSGMRVAARTLYLLRPSFELRYGLPTVRFGAPWFAGAREILCTGAYYLLGPGEAGGGADAGLVSA